MTDLYDRDKIPEAPPKVTHFSPLRPLKMFLNLIVRLVKLAFFLVLVVPWCWASLWKDAKEESKYSYTKVPLFCAVVLYLIMFALQVSFTGFFLSLIGINAAFNSWLLWTCVGGSFILMFVIYYAFKLDEEKSAKYWTELLLEGSPK